MGLFILPSDRSIESYLIAAKDNIDLFIQEKEIKDYLLTDFTIGQIDTALHKIQQLKEELEFFKAEAQRRGYALPLEKQ